MSNKDFLDESAKIALTALGGDKSFGCTNPLVELVNTFLVVFEKEMNTFFGKTRSEPSERAVMAWLLQSSSILSLVVRKSIEQTIRMARQCFGLFNDEKSRKQFLELYLSAIKCGLGNEEGT